MVKVRYYASFLKIFSKIKNGSLRDRIIVQIEKIATNPTSGKPMRYVRKNTREVYISPYRLAYLYDVKNDVILITDFYHKKKQ